MTLLSLERGSQGEAPTVPGASSRGPGRKKAVEGKSELPALWNRRGWAVDMQTWALKERTGCLYLIPSTHPSDTSPIPSTVLGATRTCGDVAQEGAASQSRCGCNPGGSVGPWHGTPGGATSSPGLQTQLCPHIVGALASGTLSLLCIVLIQSPVTELR